MQTAASSRDYAKYNALVFVMSFAVLSAVVFSIVQMTDDYKDSRTLVDKAVHWQLRTKGTVGLSSAHTTAFKILSGQIHLDSNNVNALVLGSSTMMGIRREMFPKGIRIYNYSKNYYPLYQNSGPLKRAIAEAYYFIERYDNVQWIIMGLDISLGLKFGDFKIVKYNADVEDEEISLKGIFADAITLSRLEITLKNIWADLFSGKRGYPCPENDGMSRDFGTVLSPGQCAGFRYDGSATFNYHGINKAEWKRQLNEKGLRRYIEAIEQSAEEANKSYLIHLKTINDMLMSRSGRLIMVSPPLMPDAEKIILKSAAGKHLANNKKEIKRWASVNKIKFIDAGKSEDFGCVPEEFYDAHHALDRCYSKVFDKFFKNNKNIF